MSEQRKYIDFDARAGYPTGTQIRYECGVCGDVLPSMPAHAVACKCRNVIVDVDAGRVAVKDAGMLKAFIAE